MDLRLILNKTGYTKTMVRGPGSLELALEKMKERRLTKCTYFTFLKTAGSDILDCFHGCVGA